jgi:hypothetical protein
MPFRVDAEPSLVLASLDFTLSSERFAALLALLLPASSKLCSLAGIVRHLISAGRRAGFDTENTLTTQHIDGDSLLLSPLDDLRCPAQVVALFHTRNLCRFALAQEIDEGFPIDVAIFIRNV